MRKTYLGDGAYVEVDDFGDVVLTTENGITVTNRVVLEPEIYTRLVMVVPTLTSQFKSRMVNDD